MSDSNELKPNGPAGTPVPDLIEQYRVRRDAWIAQADELARLRDEVRGSAEREAMEIVTSARRDIRQIVMEARRELLVLSAQVQAALGEANGRPDPSALLNTGDIDGSSDEPAEFSDSIFAPEEAVRGMLEEASADMDLLVEEARTVPFQALEELPAATPPPEPPIVFAREPLPPPPPVSPPAPPVVSPTASRMLLSSPFPSDAVPVPSSRRVRTFVTLFAAAGIAVVVGTVMWLRSDKSSPAPQTTAAAQSTTPTAPASAPPETLPAASSDSTPPPTLPADTSTGSAPLSLRVEARRSSWLRTTVDGQSDTGRVVAQGETFRVTAQRSVALRVGDAGAVFVSVNNSEPSALGRDGQVVTRQFTLEAADRNVEPTPQPGSPFRQMAPDSQALTSPIASAPRGPAVPPPTQVPLLQPVAAAPSNASAETPPPAPRPETTPPAAARTELPTPGPSSSSAAVIAASRQWLDAYHRQDRAAMASLSTDGLQLADERRNEERFPANVDVNRSLEKVSVQIAADTAVLTAVMTERSPDNGVPPRVSPISQVWELRGNQWRVRQVRLVSEARLNQIFR